MDRLFDTFNSRSPFAKGYKQRIHPGNLHNCLSFFQEADSYIRSLKTYENSLLLNSKRLLKLCKVERVEQFPVLFVLCL